MASLFSTALTFVVSVSCLNGCYRGVSNSESVRVIDVQTQTPNRVAMIVERSDHAALSGNTFFVFVSDHIYQMPELRKRLYALDPVFMNGLGGFTIGWSGPDELTISCQSCGITRDIIEKQLNSQQGIRIRYVGFP